MPGDVAYSRTYAALLHGAIAVPLALTLVYQVHDPLAVGVELPCSGHCHRFDVARDALVHGLWPGLDAVDHIEQHARHVHCSMSPGADRALLILRDATGRWPLSIPAVGLGEFLATTYEMCPRYREQSIVDAELSTQLVLIAMTRGDQP